MRSMHDFDLCHVSGKMQNAGKARGSISGTWGSQLNESRSNASAATRRQTPQTFSMDSTDARHPVFNRDFRYLWIGNTVSGCGDQFFLVALRSLLLVAAILNFCITGPMSVGIAVLAKREFGSSTAVMGAGAGFLNVQLLAWFQQVDRTMMGRVMSVLMFASLGLMPLSLAAAGVAVQWSLFGMFAGAGVLVISVTIIAALHRPVREIA